MHDLRLLFDHLRDHSTLYVYAIVVWLKSIAYPIIATVVTLILLIVLKLGDMVTEWGISRGWKHFRSRKGISTFWVRVQPMFRSWRGRQSHNRHTTEEKDELAKRLAHWIAENQKNEISHANSEKDELKKMLIYAIALLVFLLSNHDDDSGAA